MPPAETAPEPRAERGRAALRSRNAAWAAQHACAVPLGRPMTIERGGPRAQRSLQHVALFSSYWRDVVGERRDRQQRGAGAGRGLRCHRSSCTAPERPAAEGGAAGREIPPHGVTHRPLHPSVTPPPHLPAAAVDD